MQRIQMCKNINRNNNSMVNHTNHKPPRINPEILVGQIWLQDDEPTSVEIIELNSSNDAESPHHRNPHEATETMFCDIHDEENLSHPWCYVNHRSHDGNTYKINEKARERRRSNINKLKSLTNSLTNLHDNYANNASNYADEKITLNHQMNYFTILNRHFIPSETSSDSMYEDVEVMTAGDIIMGATDDWNAYNTSYDEEIITYDPSLDKETRTIWIYSFKNKHLLADTEMEIANTSNETSSCSTSCSIDTGDNKLKDKSTSVHRITSPIPAAYIPRLNLSIDPALSTVSEVTEKQMSSNETKDNAKEIPKKRNNSWLKDNNSTGGVDKNRSEKSTNIVNWMALSPRERRRRFNDSGDKWKGTALHLGESCQSDTKFNSDKPQNRETTLVDKVEVHVEVHASEKTRSVRSPKSEGALTKATFSDMTDINTIQDSIVNVESCIQDRGDYDVKICRRKPQISLSNKFKTDATITDPLDKIETSNWIYEDQDEKQTANYDYVLEEAGNRVKDDNINGDSKNNVIWVKNTMGLMRPAQWIDYLPITDTPISLHLSLSSIVSGKRKSWYKRLAKCVICCK